MHAGNKFLQDYKPWESIKTDKELCGSYLAACMGLVALLAALVEPYMPSVTRKVGIQCCCSIHCSLDITIHTVRAGNTSNACRLGGIGYYHMPSHTLGS